MNKCQPKKLSMKIDKQVQKVASYKLAYKPVISMDDISTINPIVNLLSSTNLAHKPGHHLAGIKS